MQCVAGDRVLPRQQSWKIPRVSDVCGARQGTGRVQSTCEQSRALPLPPRRRVARLGRCSASGLRPQWLGAGSSDSSRPAPLGDAAGGRSGGLKAARLCKAVAAGHVGDALKQLRLSFQVDDRI